ncbi:MAG: M20/M25/M40 family metallo-hydrolase, partial [Bacillota bacterium]|nr:M20/M25/M40 family metallo-hydrolase [Bacillota bacterium]
MINYKRLVERFMKYVRIDSETGNEREFYLILIEELKNLGLEVITDDSGKKAKSNANNIYCYLKNSNENKSRIFSSHMDTVKPGISIEPVIEDGLIKSKGDTILGADDKAGIAAIMESIHTITEKKLEHNNIEIVFTISEEGGLKGSKNLNYDLLKSKEAYIIDSGSKVGTIINQAPAQYKIDFEVIGKSSHAGTAPENGISAINVAAKAISQMKLLRIDEETTANIGSFNADGETNIVNSKALFKAEARSLSNEKLEKQVNHMIEIVEKETKESSAEVKINKKFLYKSYKIDENETIIKNVEKIMKKLDIDVYKKSSGGGSD